MTAHEPCSHECLCVYEITGAGVDEDQARRLAEAFAIPAEKLVLRDGEASFVDPASYLAVPTVPIADSEIEAAQRDATENHFPDVPIEVRAIDYAALRRLSPPSRR